MPKKTTKSDGRTSKLQQIVGLLKFIATLDDKEIIKATIESITELIEEEINK